MAKLRRNHDKTSGGGLLSKSVVFAGIIGLLAYLFTMFNGWGINESIVDEKDEVQKIELEFEGSDYILPTDFFPTSNTGQIIKHSYYAISYNEEHEQPEWVAYELTKESIRVKNVGRTNDFRPDPKVSKASAVKNDYRGSGYDRGHLVPAGDMAFDEKAMSETFYYSNMSPQIRNFNSGIWRQLEESVRDWAWDNKHLYVISGPVLTRGILDKIGSNNVSVPEAYYKVILDYTQPSLKGIAFLMPNEIGTLPMMDYALSIDEIEEITGIDFFPQIDVEEQARLESKYDVRSWRVDGNKERARIEKALQLKNK
jgi:endonuclease G